VGWRISDHFHPWLDAQGNSGFVWSIIGAISQACSLPVTTAPDAEYIVLARVDCMQSAQPTQIASLWPARMPAPLPDDGTRCPPVRRFGG